MSAILDLAGGTALQAVSECPRRRGARLVFLVIDESILVTINGTKLFQPIKGPATLHELPVDRDGGDGLLPGEVPAMQQGATLQEGGP